MPRASTSLLGPAKLRESLDAKINKRPLKLQSKDVTALKEKFREKPGNSEMEKVVKEFMKFVD